MTAQPLPHAAGWSAELGLVFAPRHGVTRLVARRRCGPLAVQRTFHPEGAACHAYLLHPPGGVVGGDRLALDVALAPGAHALLTTPGAAKFYRSAGPRAEQVQRLAVGPGATLEWLPQEHILFPGARVTTTTHVALAAAARHCGWEIICLGRPVLDEPFSHGTLDARLLIDRDGIPLLRERLRVAGGSDLDAAEGLRGHPVSGLLWACPADGALLAAVRAACDGLVEPTTLHAATVVDGLLLVRVLAAGNAAARRLLEACWAVFRTAGLGLAPCAPRIWST